MSTEEGEGGGEGNYLGHGLWRCSIGRGKKSVASVRNDFAPIFKCGPFFDINLATFDFHYLVTLNHVQ